MSIHCPCHFLRITYPSASYMRPIVERRPPQADVVRRRGDIHRKNWYGAVVWHIF